MTRILKITDTTVGHSDICGRCDGIITPLNQSVYSEGILVAIAGDRFNDHPGSCSHITTLNIATCSPNVFINGFNVAIEGSTLDCQDIAMLNPTNQVSTKVFINN